MYPSTLFFLRETISAIQKPTVSHKEQSYMIPLTLISKESSAKDTEGPNCPVSFLCCPIFMAAFSICGIPLCQDSQLMILKSLTMSSVNHSIMDTKSSLPYKKFLHWKSEKNWKSRAMNPEALKESIEHYSPTAKMTHRTQCSLLFIQMWTLHSSQSSSCKDNSPTPTNSRICWNPVLHLYQNLVQLELNITWFTFMVKASNGFKSDIHKKNIYTTLRCPSRGGGAA